MTTISKGLDLPITGAPEQRIEVAKEVTKVGLLGDDYVGMKPTMLVAVGDKVEMGQPIFTDKKTEGVTFTAPASGKIAEVNRGDKRKFESVVIDVEGDNRIEFDGVKGTDPASLSREALTEKLTISGLWTSLRTRPYGKVPVPGSVPNSIFVQAVSYTHLTLPTKA